MDKINDEISQIRILIEKILSVTPANLHEIFELQASLDKKVEIVCFFCENPLKMPRPALYLQTIAAV